MCVRRSDATVPLIVEAAGDAFTIHTPHAFLPTSGQYSPHSLTIAPSYLYLYPVTKPIKCTH